MGKAKARERRLDAPKEPKPPTFRFFLKQQRDREDAVGDLARSVLSARGNLPANSLAAYRERLEENGCSDAQLRALEQAWRLYEEMRRP